MDAIAATGYGQALAVSQLSLVPIPLDLLAANLADLLKMSEEAVRIRVGAGSSVEALATETGADRQELRRRLAALAREEAARRRDEREVQQEQRDLAERETERHPRARHGTLGTIVDEFL